MRPLGSLRGAWKNQRKKPHLVALKLGRGCRLGSRLLCPCNWDLRGYSRVGKAGKEYKTNRKFNFSSRFILFYSFLKVTPKGPAASNLTNQDWVLGVFRPGV